MISFRSWSAETRSKAIKNRTRCLLLAETQKVAEKYNTIGNKYLMPLNRKGRDAPLNPSRATPVSSSKWSDHLRSWKMKQRPQALTGVDISLSPLSNPNPYKSHKDDMLNAVESSPVFSAVSSDDLRKLQKKLQNRSIERLIAKYENEEGQAPNIAQELKHVLAENELDSFNSVISEYDGFDAALSLNTITMVASADMLSKFKCLHFQAAAAMRNFEKLVEAINSLSESTGSSTASACGKIEASMGPLKLMSRSVEKAVNDYGSDPCQILDFLRASVYCNSVEAFDKVIGFLNADGQSQHGAYILRIKNGFESVVAVSTYGYRDVKVNIWIPCDPDLVKLGPCLQPSRAGIVAEIQLHLQEMYDVKHDIGHLMYTWVRKFDVAGITSPEILLSFR